MLQMNYTRLMWSSKFKCRRPQPDASVVIAIAVIVSIITILLYTSSKLITRIRMPQIFKGKKRKEKQIEFSCLCWTCLEVRKTECLKLFNTCPQSVEDFKTLNDLLFFFFLLQDDPFVSAGGKNPFGISRF